MKTRPAVSDKQRDIDQYGDIELATIPWLTLIQFELS